MTERIAMLTLTRIEADHLRDLVQQFSDLVNGTPSEDDPAVARLAPDVYPDDPEASREFRSLTRGDLLHRRARDAQLVRHALDGIAAEPGDDVDELSPVDLPIPRDEIEAWLRTLAALRLVIANRLGIETDADHDAEDPRFGVYDWLGYRLEGLVTAADELDRQGDAPEQ